MPRPPFPARLADFSRGPPCKINHRLPPPPPQTQSCASPSPPQPPRPENKTPVLLPPPIPVYGVRGPRARRSRRPAGCPSLVSYPNLLIFYEDLFCARFIKLLYFGPKSPK